jgi:muramoyltetrapeptide carboxypeptidase
MNRRNFQKTILSTFGALSLPAIATAEPSSIFHKRKYPKNILKPNRLKIGARVGLIAPSSPIAVNRWQQTIRNMESMGFELEYDEKAILAKHGYLAGNDKARAREVNRMFADKSIDAIWCVRGGYGSARLLPMLDYDLIKANPKVIIGYSDITALLHGIFLETGLVGFHGPVGASQFTPYSTKQATSVLMTPQEQYTISFPEENLSEKDISFQPFIIKDGNAVGPLIGGNLTLVTSLLGTPYELETKEKLVFLEEIGEKPYRIDRMLTQLLLAGKLQDAAGIVLGVFSDCEAPADDNSLTLRETLEDRLTNLGIPVIYGLSFGHIANNCTLPMGIKAELNTSNKTLTLLETAVL